MISQSPVPLRVKLAVQVMHCGGVIAYPTEAIWGLGCDPNNKNAVMRLLALKKRSIDKGLILVAASIEQMQPYLNGLETTHLDKLNTYWPGPVTCSVPHNGTAPKWITGEFSSIALRVSAHPLITQLCQTFGGPIVSTSANVSGFPPTRWEWQLHKRLGTGLDYVLHGSVGKSSRPSQIRDLITDKILRQG